MKKLLTAICSLALVASMGFGVSSFAELDDEFTGEGTITIEAVDISGTATINTDFTIDPNTDSLATIWSTGAITLVNTSAAPIFYVFSEVNQVGAAVLAETAELFDDALLADATAVAFGAGIVSFDALDARSDAQWTNIGVTLTNTQVWLGDATADVDLFDIYTGEVAGNSLASQYGSAAEYTNEETLTIRTGTSWASAVVITFNIVATFELTAGMITLA